MKMLFHCCCAPCAVACLGDLAASGITPRLFWYNPNIHPCAEYQSRRNALVQFAASGRWETDIIDEYGLRTFIRDAVPDKPGRCEYCYRLRLEKTAAQAAEKGFDAFSTSLLISPYQDHDLIRRIGGELAARWGLQFWYRDFRPRFREGQEQSRALGLYMQKYCGCIFSEEERYLKPAAVRGPVPV